MGGYATNSRMAHRFSHAIAEGDGISVIAAVEDPDSLMSTALNEPTFSMTSSRPSPAGAVSPVMFREASVVMRRQLDVERLAGL